MKKQQVVVLFVVVALALSATMMIRPAAYDTLLDVVKFVVAAVWLVTLFCFVFGVMAVFGYIASRGLDVLDARWEPEVPLSQVWVFLLAMAFAVLAFLWQMEIASRIIPFSALRPIMDSIGQVAPVLERLNPFWGMWGSFLFLCGFYLRKLD